MKVRRLTAQQAVKLLSEFYNTCPDEMEKAFGWSHEPETLGRNETVYEVSDDIDGADADGKVERRRVVVGFGIIEMNLKDARDTEAFLSAGVFPMYRRMGYWHKITAWTVAKSKELGADFASRIVNKDNEEHYNRSMREAHTEGSGWVYAGDNWWPGKGHGYFVWPFDEKEHAEAKKNGHHES